VASVVMLGDFFTLWLRDRLERLKPSSEKNKQ
jgi:hypothetical protein